MGSAVTDNAPRRTVEEVVREARACLRPFEKRHQRPSREDFLALCQAGEELLGLLKGDWPSAQPFTPRPITYEAARSLMGEIAEALNLAELDQDHIRRIAEASVI